MDLELSGQWFVTCRNPDGSIVWRERIDNAAVNAALNDILTVYFANGGSIKPNWYFGLVNNVGFAGFSPGDTISSHSGWTEFTGYNEANRQQWASLTVAGQAISNGTFATFTMNANGTLAGFFLASDNTKGGTAGLLWSTGAMSPAQQVFVGQQLQLAYVIQASAAQ